MSDVTEVDAQLGAYNARDLESLVACYTSYVVIANTSGDVLAKGHDDLREMYRGLIENSPQLCATIHNRIAVGNYVADHEAVEGFNLPGSPTSFQAIATYNVIEGKISRVALDL